MQIEIKIQFLFFKGERKLSHEILRPPGYTSGSLPNFSLIENSNSDKMLPRALLNPALASKKEERADSSLIQEGLGSLLTPYSSTRPTSAFDNVSRYRRNETINEDDLNANDSSQRRTLFPSNLIAESATNRKNVSTIIDNSKPFNNFNPIASLTKIMINSNPRQEEFSNSEKDPQLSNFQPIPKKVL